MPRARRSTPHQSNSRPRGTNPSDIAARLLRVSRRPSCASRKQRVFVIKFMRPSSCAVAQLLYGVLVCGEPVLLSTLPLPETPETEERPPAALATSKRVITCPNFGFGSKSFREIGFSSRPRRHINSAFGSARVDILARFKRIKFRRVFLHTIQPPRAIHLSNFVGAENVSFPRHVTSRRPLVSGTATPSPPRTANMNALRLTVLAATIAYASAQQGTCEVCHLHYYHKVRPARR